MADIKKAAEGDKIVKLTDVVNFKAGVDKDFKGIKYMADGKVYKVHRLHGERLEKKGLGKIQEIQK